MEEFMKDQYQAQGLVDVVVGGQTYTITLIPARASAKLALDIAKIFLAPIGSAIDNKSTEKYRMPDESTIWTEVAAHIVNGLDSIDLFYVVDTLLKDVSNAKGKIDVDVEFRGKISGLISLTEQAMRENWTDFFTVYLKEKGIDLSSLSQMMKPGAQEELEESGPQ